MLALDGAGTSSVRRTRRLAELARVYEDGVEAVVLERRLPRAIARDAERFACERGRSRHTWRRGEPSSPTGCAAMDADLGHLAEVFADLIGCDEVGVRAEALRSPMCPRWHVDRVELRLVTTYLGPGPELVTGRDVWRERVGADDVLRPDARLLRARKGDVVLLKGEAWRGNDGRGVVHRSPRHTGTRLVVTMDPLV